ncbi:aldehyde oxidase 2 [Danaus plexippus plexippus]|uniref:Aldehyde oxidase 2 n=1 Tax=Danaus plexippus plexippus TaxID=278856 RepID=A0A212FI14_DANPL|nr:aldehyde oxidase 2 [Danaus plexippus plexippus]
MSRIQFRVNNLQCSVGSEVSSSTTLLEYLRRHLELRGTKYMCLEGGCGACIVNVVKSPGEASLGVNSCMVPITSCNGWDITTIEGIGNRLKGYHPIQVTLAENNGSQCGYCSPGWVMALYSILRNRRPTMLEIEQSFGSNICRCTGYRPILEAFKKFAIDSPDVKVIPDIEDLRLCEKSREQCSKNSCSEWDWCVINKSDLTDDIPHIQLRDHRDWFKATTIDNIFSLWQQFGTESYMLVGGNTGKGVVPILEYPKLLIDINHIPELHGYYVDQNLVIGASTTLTDLMTIFEFKGATREFNYLNILNDHLRMVAHIAIRNCMVPITSCNGWDITTIEGIGNRLKGYHPIQVTLAENNGSQCGYCSPGWVMALYSILRNRRPTMLEIEQSFGSNICRCTGYRPILEAFKKFAIDSPDVKVIPDIEDLRLCEKSREQCSKNSCSEWDWCVINKSDLTDDIPHIQLRDHRDWFKATTIDNIFSLWQQFGTESYMLVGGNTGKGVIPILEYPKLLIDINHISELHGYYVDQNLVIGASTTLTDLMTIFEFKGATREFNYLNILNDHLRMVAHIAIRNSATIGGNLALKNLHPGFQSDIYIILETAGAQLTISTDIDSRKVVTMQEFLKMDMKGKIIKNVILPPLNDKHKIVTFKVAPRSQNAHAWVHAGFHYIVDSYDIVLDCIIVYGGLSPNYTRSWKTEQYLVGKHLWNNKTLQGALNVLSEELQVSESLPDPPVQFRRLSALGLFYKGLLSLCPQEILNPRYISGMTKIHNTRPLSQGRQNFETNPALWPINLPIPKLEALIQCAGEAEYTEDLPTLPREVYAAFVLTTVPLGTITKIDASKALVAINHDGVIQYVDYDLYSDNGYIVNETLLVAGTEDYNNAYRSDKWKYRSFTVTTDTPSNSWCRAPGSLEHVAMAETILERIAYEMNIDPFEIRLTNFDSIKYDEMIGMITRIRTESQYDERRVLVEKFNIDNRWKKRGLKVSFLRWNTSRRKYLDVNLDVYKDDGTVAITHGGIEMGQGMNTRAVQICASFLDIPLDKIQIKCTNTINAPNNSDTESSVTSQNVGRGVRRCCEELLTRLEPAKKQLHDPTWVELVQKAYAMNIDLQVHGFVSPNDEVDQTIYGVTVAEVEIDVLTGEWEILRVDLIEDVGRSINPDLDVGQIEGAFVMGLGYWTTENIVYEPESGEILSDRTWQYWVPGARDIPQDFRIYFRKRSFSNDAFLGSKATGEPATCMAIVIPFAMRGAIASAREETGIPKTEWFQIGDF